MERYFHNYTKGSSTVRSLGTLIGFKLIIIHWRDPRANRAVPPKNNACLADKFTHVISSTIKVTT
jgi:hypothetical protein